MANQRQINRAREALRSRDESTALSVGEDKLAFVREYVLLYKVGRIIRQADIAAALEVEFGLTTGSASGTASTACRRLEVERLIEPVRKVRGSNAWRRLSSRPSVTRAA